MEFSENGFAKLVEFEGFRPDSYQDIGGIWTIGIGSITHPDGSKVQGGETIDRTTAEVYARHDLVNFEKFVNSNVKSTITQDQYDMLVSLCYNIGINALLISSVLKTINTDPTLTNSQEIIHDWKKWDEVNHVVSKGLLSRRNQELFTFFSSKITLADIIAVA